MTILEKDAKILWGKAAGRCSMPTCRIKLIDLLDQDDPYLLGEMAHVIAHSKLGPRAKQVEPDDTYNNLILLCPTHHTRIDKAPKQFPAELLRQWKFEHEKWVDDVLSEHICQDINELMDRVNEILLENKSIWKSIGPESELAKSHPGSNAYKLWNLRKLDTIIPNNKKILNLITKNKNFLNASQIKAFFDFKNHALAYEMHAIDRLENYPRFPKSFSLEFEHE